MQHKNLNIVLGPPGTGKTTKLLNLVEQHLNEGIRPEHIGYLAFTRKAADEAAFNAEAAATIEALRALTCECNASRSCVLLVPPNPFEQGGFL